MSQFGLSQLGVRNLCSSPSIACHCTNTLIPQTGITRDASCRPAFGKLEYTCTSRRHSSTQSLKAFPTEGGGSSAAGSATTSTPLATAAGVKAELEGALQGLDRGIFGVKAAQREHVLSLLEDLERLNPQPAPMQDLAQVAGEWRLLFSTIVIQGSKRTKLGLREVVTLGDLLQRIDVQQQSAVNEVQFAVRGLSLLRGTFTIEATYTPVSDTRVDIEFVRSSLVPDQLQRLFEKNHDLLLSLFNPQGWLEVTYVDGSHRVGRDDKGNVFYLERVTVGADQGQGDK